jgi:hypothetical protein
LPQAESPIFLGTPEKSSVLDHPADKRPSGGTPAVDDLWREALQLRARLEEIATVLGVSLNADSALKQLFHDLAKARVEAEELFTPEDIEERTVSVKVEGDLKREIQKIHLKMQEIKAVCSAMKNRIDAVSADLSNMRNDVRVLKIAAHR